MHAFTQLLSEIRSGEAIEQYGAELATLVAAVRETGKKGAITLTIDIKPASKGDDMTLVISDKIKLSMPEPERGQTVMYGNEDGTLSRRDPRQPDMLTLRDASAPESAAHTPA